MEGSESSHELKVGDLDSTFGRLKEHESMPALASKLTS